MPDRAVVNANGAFGLSSLGATLPTDSNSYDTSANVSAGRVVSLGTTGTVAHSATDGTASLCLGVTQAAATSGNTVLVVQRGYASALAQGTIAAGDVLKRSTTTSGAVQATATPGVGEAIGVAIAASSGGNVDMFVAKSL